MIDGTETIEELARIENAVKSGVLPEGLDDSRSEEKKKDSDCRGRREEEEGFSEEATACTRSDTHPGPYSQVFNYSLLIGLLD